MNEKLLLTSRLTILEENSCFYWNRDGMSRHLDELRVEKRNKKKKKKTTLTLPSVKAKCVTSNQI